MDFIVDPGPVIVGFDFSGDDMLRGEMHTLEQGLTVLYGLNGTGKSRLLRGIRGALLGVQTDVRVSLVARAAVTSAVGDYTQRVRSGQPPAARPFALALAQELADPSDYVASPGQRSSERLLLPEVTAAVIMRHIDQMVGWDYPELRAEVLQDRLFLLAPIGTEENPSWVSYAVADASRPAARAGIALAADVADAYPDERELDQASDEWAEAFDAYVERLRAVPVLEEAAQLFTARGPRVVSIKPSSVVLYNATMSDLEYEAPITIIGPIDFELDVLDLERDADAATQDYAERLVSGALADDWRFEDGAEADSTFPLGEPGNLRKNAWRLHDSDAESVAALIERTVGEAAAQLGERVTTALEGVLLDPLVAELHVEPTALRIAVSPLEWRFNRPSTNSASVGMQSLSKAERLWAERSINEAVYWHRRDNDEQLKKSLRPVVYLLDEPESALHRAAEAFMARSLRARAADPRTSLIVATHSPELLDTTEARLVNLQHPQTFRAPTVQRLDLSDRRALSELGLTPSDLLRWPRILLLVEGLHDEVLLEHWLGDRLRSARVDTLVLRGGTKLPLTVDSRVLFEHTEAHVVGLVDNEDAKTLRETWEKAQEAAAQGDTQGAIGIVLAGIPRTRSESLFILNWLTAALERGLDGRITPYALERADVVEYLPVEAFVPSAASWDALKTEHQAARAASPTKTAKEFKPWLRVRYGVDFTDKSLRAAAAGIPVPVDFERLMKTVEAISARRG